MLSFQVTTLLGKVEEMDKSRATAEEVADKTKEVESQREAVSSLKQVWGDFVPCSAICSICGSPDHHGWYAAHVKGSAVVLLKF